MASPGPEKVTVAPQSRHCRSTNVCSIVMFCTVLLDRLTCSEGTAGFFRVSSV
jgi:hypothetical protein